MKDERGKMKGESGERREEREIMNVIGKGVWDAVVGC
jgi:hypothetical protein